MIKRDTSGRPYESGTLFSNYHNTSMNNTKSNLWSIFCMFVCKVVHNVLAGIQLALQMATSVILVCPGYMYILSLQWLKTGNMQRNISEDTFLNSFMPYSNKLPNDIYKKKANTTTTMTTGIFKCYKNSMLFDAQNAGNHISKLLDVKFFWGACPQTPQGKEALRPL